jgi:predicted acylesterase/phospholipase RssA
MAQPARTALVLQGGGALGAYELGAARRVYKDEGFAPDVIAGVSIGAITAVLLARPAPGLKPLVLGGVLAKNRRVWTVSPATFPALRVRSRQPQFLRPAA